MEALSLATGKVEWDTKVPQLPLGAATVSNDLVFTTLYNGVLVALNRRTGAIVYRRQLPTSTNSPIAIAGNTVIVPAGGPAHQHGKRRPAGRGIHGAVAMAACSPQNSRQVHGVLRPRKRGGLETPVPLWRPSPQAPAVRGRSGRSDRHG